MTYDRPEPDPNIQGDDLHGEYPREYRYKDGTTDPFGTPLDFIEDKVCHGHVDVMRYGPAVGRPIGDDGGATG